MAEIQKVDTLIISDIHLGSDVSRARAVLDLLDRFHFDRLILLGDIFDDLNFNRLKHDHFELISRIRLLTNFEKRHVEVVWIFGNHDELLVRVMQVLLGLEVKREYLWEFRGKKFFAIHGHQFDYFLVHNRVLSNLSTWFYRLVQAVDSRNYRLSRYLKRTSKGWLRISKIVGNGAVKLGEKMGADYVFCGHTHQALHWTVGKIEYYNTGCWTDVPSTYVTIDENGVVESHKVF